jgi:hypothetical protein
LDYSVDGANQTPNEKDQERWRECHEKYEYKIKDHQPNRGYRIDQVGQPRVATFAVFAEEIMFLADPIRSAKQKQRCSA